MRIAAGILLLWASLMSSAFAQTQAQKDDAKWIMERITGVKWASDSAVMQQAYTMAAAGNRAGIAALAASQPQFLNVTVKNFGLVMSTREETIRIPLNDFAASIMGVTRDQTDARELLYGNFFYAGDANILADQNAFAANVLKSNKHYEDLDNRRQDMGALLVRINSQRLIQSEADGGVFTLAPNPDPAGILTSRTWVGAHSIAGTARRNVEYTGRQFLCLPIEKWADAAAADVRIGRDIDRFPGGDNMKFQTTCKACHNIMDPFRGAFAKWNFEDDSAVHSSVRRGNSNGQGIMNKMNQNATVYPGGYITVDDSWINNADRGANSTTLGWRGLDGRTPASTGFGVNTFGRLIANSKRFSECMSKRVFESVCRKDVGDTDWSVYQAMATTFEASNYNLKKLFQDAALNARCK
jgi:hypothetical protein